MQSLQQEQFKRDIVACINKWGSDRDYLNQILAEIHQKYGAISGSTIQIIAECLDVSPVEIYGVISFYPSLKENAGGRCVLSLCKNQLCDMRGKEAVAIALEDKLGITFGQQTKDGSFSLQWQDCLGLCDQGPILTVNDLVYTHVTPDKVEEIISAYKGENRNTTICPDDYQIRSFCFSPKNPGRGLRTMLSKPREKVIREKVYSKSSWNFQQNKCAQGCVIGNADEGEPGAFKNQHLLTTQLEDIFEGMSIVAYLAGMRRGVLYIPQRYAYLRPSIQTQLDECRQLGLLGKSIGGMPDFDFDINVHIGLDSYAGRDESTLLAEIEGRRAEPSHDRSSGRAAIIHDIETYVRIARICADSQEGPIDIENKLDKSPKLLSISGDCKFPGIYELTKRTKIRDLLDLVGAENTKAVQVGGLSGECVPVSNFDLILDPEDLPQVRALVIYDNRRSMLQVAGNILAFFESTSCGQCVPCREGLPLLVQSIIPKTDLKKKRLPLHDIRSLAKTLQLASKCSLGQSAPNALLSILDNFPNDR